MSREWSDAHAANAVLDAHGDDPEFGYRFLGDELRDKGLQVSDHQVLKACRLVHVRCCHSIRRGSGKRPGPPVHDDLSPPWTTGSHQAEPKDPVPGAPASLLALSPILGMVVTLPGYTPAR